MKVLGRTSNSQRSCSCSFSFFSEKGPSLKLKAKGRFCNLREALSSLFPLSRFHSFQPATATVHHFQTFCPLQQVVLSPLSGVKDIHLQSRTAGGVMANIYLSVSQGRPSSIQMEEMAIDCTTPADSFAFLHAARIRYKDNVWHMKKRGMHIL